MTVCFQQTVDSAKRSPLSDHDQGQGGEKNIRAGKKSHQAADRKQQAFQNQKNNMQGSLSL